MKSSRRENLPSKDSRRDLSRAVSCCSVANRDRSISFSSSSSVTLGANAATELVVEVHDVIDADLSRPERTDDAAVLPEVENELIRVGGGIELGETPLALI